MNENLPSPDFDWVTARAKCSATDMYEVLRSAAKANIATRNKILDESGDKDRFQFKERQPRGFTVWDTWETRIRRAVDVDLDGQTIKLARQVGEAITTVTASLTLNDRGQCKFKIGSEELDQWQVLKRVLEPIFF